MNSRIEQSLLLQSLQHWSKSGLESFQDSSPLISGGLFYLRMDSVIFSFKGWFQEMNKHQASMELSCLYCWMN